MQTDNHQQEKTPQANKRKRLPIILGGTAVLMFGFAFALVPLYNTLCKVLGINGKTSTAATVNHNVIDKSRSITVQFLATNNERLPWEFHPIQKTVEVHPGESVRIAYFAQNDSNHEMTVQAIPSVTPALAAQYLKKTECFCFQRQTLKSHAKMDMPLIFHLDPKLPKSVHTVTLSYTLFDVSNMQKQTSKPTGKIS